MTQSVQEFYLFVFVVGIVIVALFCFVLLFICLLFAFCVRSSVWALIFLADVAKQNTRIWFKISS